MFAHVLLLGRTSFQNLRLSFGLNPRGGISFAPVANINKAGRVIWYGLDPPEDSFASSRSKIIKCIKKTTYEFFFQISNARRTFTILQVITPMHYDQFLSFSNPASLLRKLWYENAIDVSSC